MGGLPHELQVAIGDMDDAITQLEKNLAPLFDASIRDACESLPAIDEAKLHGLVGYGVLSLLFAYLNTQGVSTVKHPVRPELQRIRQYLTKLKNVASGNPTRTVDNKSNLGGTNASQAPSSNTGPGSGSAVSKSKADSKSETTASPPAAKEEGHKPKKDTKKDKKKNKEKHKKKKDRSNSHADSNDSSAPNVTGETRKGTFSEHTDGHSKKKARKM